MEILKKSTSTLDLILSECTQSSDIYFINDHKGSPFNCLKNPIEAAHSAEWHFNNTYTVYLDFCNYLYCKYIYKKHGIK